MTGVGLGVRDLRGVLAFVADAHDVDAPEPLTTELLDRLTELFRCEYATYQEFDWRRRVQISYVACSNEDPFLPESASLPDDFWDRNEARDPRLNPERAPFDKWSDRLDRRERERLRDEDDYNAEFRIVDSIGFRVGDVRTRSVWLHFESQSRDFEARDLELAIALQPHVEALRRRTLSRRQASELLGALEADRDAIIVLEANGTIDHATPEARRLLSVWFGTRNDRLPYQLDDWLALANPGDQYASRRNGTVLTVEAAGDFTLRLREHPSHSTCVTAREREVLAFVAEGLTNSQIARRLWVAESTVAKHLEQAYVKLGVHSRTAAVARLRKLSS